MKTKTLSERAILIRLSFSVYTGRILDKTLTAEMRKSHNIEGKRANAYKYLMACDELAAIVNGTAQGRKEIECLSLPWFDDGFRMVPASKFVEVKQRVNAIMQKFNDNVNAFITVYRNKVNADKIALGSAYNPADYLSETVLRSRFGVRFECIPLPVVEKDWRISGIDAEMAKEIAESVETETAARLAEGKRELLASVRQTVLHLAGLVSEEGKRFKGASIDNIIEEAMRVSSLNVTDDKTLETLANDIADTFKGIDAETIRDSDSARKEAEALCKETLASIDAAMSGIY